MTGSGGNIFFGTMKKAVKYHRADTINREPWTIKKSTVAKGTVLCKKDEDFPENFQERKSESAGKLRPVWVSAPVRRVVKNPVGWNIFSCG